MAERPDNVEVRRELEFCWPNLPLVVTMQAPWLAYSTFWLLFVSAHALENNLKPTVTCTVCNGYHICKPTESAVAECQNGHPCTKEQHRLCTKMLNQNPNGRCDRPGVFPEVLDPTRFYRCVLSNVTSEIVKRPFRCPRGTSFDPVTVRCLTEKEKALLSEVEDLEGGAGATRESFQCRRQGTFPDPEDCKAYHECDAGLRPRDFYCPVGTYFNKGRCSGAKTERCVRQLVKQSEEQMKEGEKRYKQLVESKYRPPMGVLKTQFDGTAGMKYGIYGLGDRLVSKALVSEVQQVIESIISKYKSRGKGYNLTKLQAAIENETAKTLTNARLMRTKLNISSCEDSLTDKRSLSKPVTIIVVSDCNCNENSRNIKHTDKGKPNSSSEYTTQLAERTTIETPTVEGGHEEPSTSPEETPASPEEEPEEPPASPEEEPEEPPASPEEEPEEPPASPEEEPEEPPASPEEEAEEMPASSEGETENPFESSEAETEEPFASPEETPASSEEKPEETFASPEETAASSEEKPEEPFASEEYDEDTADHSLEEPQMAQAYSPEAQTSQSEETNTVGETTTTTDEENKMKGMKSTTATESTTGTKLSSNLKTTTPESFTSVVSDTSTEEHQPPESQMNSKPNTELNSANSNETISEEGDDGGSSPETTRIPEGMKTTLANKLSTEEPLNAKPFKHNTATEVMVASGSDTTAGPTSSTEVDDEETVASSETGSTANDVSNITLGEAMMSTKTDSTTAASIPSNNNVTTGAVITSEGESATKDIAFENPTAPPETDLSKFVTTNPKDDGNTTEETVVLSQTELSTEETNAHENNSMELGETVAYKDNDTTSGPNESSGFPGQELSTATVDYSDDNTTLGETIAYKDNETTSEPIVASSVPKEPVIGHKDESLKKTGGDSPTATDAYTDTNTTDGEPETSSETDSATSATVAYKNNETAFEQTVDSSASEEVTTAHILSLGKESSTPTPADTDNATSEGTVANKDNETLGQTGISSAPEEATTASKDTEPTNEVEHSLGFTPPNAALSPSETEVSSVESSSTISTPYPLMFTRKPKRFQCPYVGYLRDPEDCHSYYRCKRITTTTEDCENCVAEEWKLVASHHTCDNGQWFSNFLWKCVKSRPLGC